MQITIGKMCQLLLAATVVSSGHAAEEIQGDVPLDLVKALLSNFSPMGIRLFSDVPDNFPEITLPDSVEVLGSADMGHSQQLLLQVEGDGVQQRAQIMVELERLGYTMLIQPTGFTQPQTGFIAPRFIPPAMPVQFCHDVQGMVTVRIIGALAGPGMMPQGGQAFVSSVPPGGFIPSRDFTVVDSSSVALATMPSTSIINVTTTGDQSGPRSRMGGATCAQMQEQFSGRAQQGQSITDLQQHLPRMELPSASISSLSGTTPFVSGFPSGFESSLDIVVDWELERLFHHITEQVSQQDWQSDTETVGDISATANWTRDIENRRLFGSLRVLKTAESQYRLLFSIQNLSSQ